MNPHATSVQQRRGESLNSKFPVRTYEAKIIMKTQ